MFVLYSYAPDRKEEVFWSVSDLHEEGGISERKGHSRVGHKILNMIKRAPIGDMLCDLLSMPVTEIWSLLEKERMPPRWEEWHARNLDPWSEDERLPFYNIVFLLREFFDICSVRPELYSPAGFNYFLAELGVQKDLPKSAPYVIEKEKFAQDKVILEFDCPDFGDGDIESDIKEFMEDYDCVDLSAPSPDHNIAVLRKKLDEYTPFTSSRQRPDGAIGTVDIPGMREAILGLAKTAALEHKVIKKCKICGKYFSPRSNRADALYCDRPCPDDPTQTCKQYGTHAGWYKEKKKDEVVILARKISSAKQMLAKRHPERPEYKKMLEYFQREKKKVIYLYESGEMTAEEAMKWLYQMREQKTLKGSK